MIGLPERKNEIKGVETVTLSHKNTIPLCRFDTKLWFVCGREGCAIKLLSVSGSRGVFFMSVKSIRAWWRCLWGILANYWYISCNSSNFVEFRLWLSTCIFSKGQANCKYRQSLDIGDPALRHLCSDDSDWIFGAYICLSALITKDWCRYPPNRGTNPHLLVPIFVGFRLSRFSVTVFSSGREAPLITRECLYWYISCKSFNLVEFRPEVSTVTFPKGRQTANTQRPIEFLIKMPVCPRSSPADTHDLV